MSHHSEKLTEHAEDKAQEWTVFGTSVQSNVGPLFHCSTRKDAEIASIEHNASIELAYQKGREDERNSTNPR